MLAYSRWKIIVVATVVVLGIIFGLPNLVSKEDVQSWPDWGPKSQIALGLDLQGGSHLLLQVDVAAVVRERLETQESEARRALRPARIGYRGLGVRDETLSFTLTDPSQMDQALDLMREQNPLLQDNMFGTSINRELEIEQEGSDRVVISMSDAGRDQRVSSAVQQSLEVIRRRVDQFGTTEASIQRQGDDRILLQVPGVDPEELKRRVGTTARMTFHMVDMEASIADALSGRVPAGSMLVEADESNEGPEHYVVRREVELSGDNLVDAQPSVDQNNLPAVSFRFDNAGARKFGSITQEYTGRLFAIVLDDKVVSAPRIREPILGGSGIITGNFTFEQANELSVLLRAGALPAPITFLEERSVGPDLGADSVAAGKLASVLALIAVAIFMIVYYGLFGIFANIALFVNLILIVGGLSVLGATLTLPGIAGIVLTIGMAVDANVLIFERIREEIARGRTPLSAIDTGYNEALRAIIDANVTTLIAALVLFQFGSGPVKGFAVTLSIGILTSLFSAIMVTPPCHYSLVPPAAAQDRAALSGRGHLLMRLRLLPDKPNVDFMRWRVVAIGGSAAAFVLSLLLVFWPGLNYGIDFEGGIMIEIETPEPPDLGDLRERLNGLELGSVALQEFGASNDILIRVPRQDGEDEGAGQQAAIDTVRAELANALGDEISYRRTEFVGPKVSAELLRDGLLAISITLVAVLIYIWFRFEWQYGLGAILALVHDVALTIGMFAVLQLEVNLSTVAAVLTIVGYSLNDTVVIFDRVRENLRKYKTMPMVELINTSINETLARTLMTSVTTLIALFCLFFFGGEVIKGFTFAMIWGVLIGTYSTVYVASPLLVYLNLRQIGASKAAKDNTAEPAES